MKRIQMMLGAAAAAAMMVSCVQVPVSTGVQHVVVVWLKKPGDGVDRERVVAAIENNYAEKEAQIGGSVMREFERSVMLQILDSHWKEHLAQSSSDHSGVYGSPKAKA
jgi:preprotein translocase subunit SecA